MGVLTDYKPLVATNVATDTSRERAASTQRRTRTFQCLVASGSQPRREMFSQSVQAAGWESMVCNDLMQAWTALHRELFQMAVVDLQQEAGQPVDFRELCEQLAAQRNMLLMVCGNDADTAEEVWARQLGAWLYLPGVSTGSDLETLCFEGRTIAQRLGRVT